MRAVAILHIPDSPFGAVRIGYRRLTAAAAAAGHTLDVVTPDQLPFVSRLHPRLWVLFIPVAVVAWLWPRRRRYDLAIFHSYSGWLFNLLPARPPAITDFHGLEPLFHAALVEEHRARGRRLSLRYRLTYGWLMPKVLRVSCRRSVLVTCLNGDERRYLLDHRWAEPDRVAIVRQSVPPEFFVDAREYRPSATCVVALCQWLDTKGTAYLVDAFCALARRHPALELRCCGTRIPASRVLEDFPADVRPRVRVDAEIREPDIAAVYREADIFVHASLSEGSANAIMQAMASALPIVSTRVGVAVDLLEDGRDYLEVPKADAPALASAIERLIDDADLRRTLGTAARRAADALGFDQASSGWLAVLQRAVSARG